MDGGEGVRRRPVGFRGGGCDAVFLCMLCDVWVLDPLGLVGDAFVVQDKSALPGPIDDQLTERLWMIYPGLTALSKYSATRRSGKCRRDVVEDDSHV